LAPYAAKIVTVSGTIVTKKGMHVIENAQLVGEQAFWQGGSERESLIRRPPDEIFAL
jgi:hypothetical protein